MSLSAVSLFSGAGGMDVGVQSAGFDVAFANDIDADACATYRLNHSCKIYEGDLRDFRRSLSDHRGTDLLFGGPPCQGFSVAGKMDPQDSRSQLLFSFFDAVDDLQPRAFICENVKALATLSKWEGVRSAMEGRVAGRYQTALITLNASQFGVPQSRERMFFVGVRTGIATNTLSSQLHSALKLEVRSPPTLGALIRELGPAGSPTNNRTCRAKISYAKNPVLRRSPYAGMLFNGAGRPLPADGISSTLAASMGGNKTPIVDEGEIFGHLPNFADAYHRSLMVGGAVRVGEAPARLRRLTIDECLAIQSFPVGYQLAGKQSSMYRQLGNAVPCRMAEAVASAVQSLLAGNRSLKAA